MDIIYMQWSGQKKGNINELFFISIFPVDCLEKQHMNYGNKLKGRISWRNDEQVTEHLL